MHPLRCNARSTTWPEDPRPRLTPPPAVRQARGPMRFPSTLRPLPCPLALTFLAACAGAPPPATAQTGAAPSVVASNATPPPPPPGEDGRLPPPSRPSATRCRCASTPPQPRFSGVTTIQVDVPAPTFERRAARARHERHPRRRSRRRGASELPAPHLGARGARRRRARGAGAAVRAAAARGAGAARDHVDYDAPFAADLAGLYRVQENGR